MNEITYRCIGADLPLFCQRCGLVETHEVHHGRNGEFVGDKIARHKFKESVDAGARLICPEDRPSEPAVGLSDRSSSEHWDSPAKGPRIHDPRCTSLKGAPWGCNCWSYGVIA